MVIGFTGTSRGMSARQQATVKYLLTELQVTALHHGDAQGADAQAHRLAKQMRIRLVVHPPDDPKKRAFCVGVDEQYPDRPYLERNRAIVEHSDGLIAAPKMATEVVRSGTWMTVRWARRNKRPIWIVLPDGSFRTENQDVL